MCKVLIVNELKKAFDCSEEKVWPMMRKAVVYLAGYLLTMLLTFLIAIELTKAHFFMVGGIFYFIFTMELTILSIVLSFLVLLIFAYYGAFFAHKGWKRYQVN